MRTKMELRRSCIGKKSCRLSKAQRLCCIQIAALKSIEVGASWGETMLGRAPISMLVNYV